MSLKLVDPSIDSMEYQRGTSSKNAVVLVMTSHVCFSDQLQFCQASAIALDLEGGGNKAQLSNVFF